MLYPNTSIDIFESNWKHYSEKTIGALDAYYHRKIATGWDDDVEKILALLRMLPAKGSGRNLQPLSSFNEAIDKLFVFRSVRKLNKQSVNQNKNFLYHKIILLFSLVCQYSNYRNHRSIIHTSLLLVMVILKRK